MFLDTPLNFFGELLDCQVAQSTSTGSLLFEHVSAHAPLSKIAGVCAHSTHVTCRHPIALNSEIGLARYFPDIYQLSEVIPPTTLLTSLLPPHSLPI